MQLAKIAADEARVAATAKAKQAAEEKARLVAQGARKADQEKAAELAKSTEEERVAAEKASEIENAKAAAAEQERNQAEAQAASGVAKAENPQDDGAKLAALSQPSPAGPSKAKLSQNIQSEREVGKPAEMDGGCDSRWCGSEPGTEARRQQREHHTLKRSRGDQRVCRQPANTAFVSTAAMRENRL